MEPFHGNCSEPTNHHHLTALFSRITALMRNTAPFRRNTALRKRNTALFRRNTALVRRNTALVRINSALFRTNTEVKDCLYFSPLPWLASGTGQPNRGHVPPRSSPGPLG